MAESEEQLDAQVTSSRGESTAGQPARDRSEVRRRRPFRRGVVGVLAVVCCLLVVLSTTVVWAHRTLLNTDTFVGTVSPVLANPAVDSAVATRATNQLFAELNLDARLHAALPPKVAFAAAPMTNATKGYVAGELTKVLESPKFQTIWAETVRSTHEDLVAVLRGQSTKVLTTAHGYIILNTVPALNQALGRVSGLASNLTGKQVTLPTITTVELPQSAIDKLSEALGVQLPSNFGQITLVRSKDLAVAQRGVRAFDRLTIVLPLLTLALIALTLWLSLARRRTLIQLMVGTLLLMILVRRVVIHAQSALAADAHNPQVAQTVIGDLLHGFFVLSAWILGFALAVLVAALLTGPYRWAAAMRGFVARTWHQGTEAVRGGHRGQAATWMATHASGLQFAGAVIAALLLLIVSVSWISFLVVGVLLAAYEVVLQRLKPPASDETPPNADSNSQMDLPSGIGRT